MAFDDPSPFSIPEISFPIVCSHILGRSHFVMDTLGDFRYLGDFCTMRGCRTLGNCRTHVVICRGHQIFICFLKEVKRKECRYNKPIHFPQIEPYKILVVEYPTIWFLVSCFPFESILEAVSSPKDRKTGGFGQTFSEERISESN